MENSFRNSIRIALLFFLSIMIMDAEIGKCATYIGVTNSAGESIVPSHLDPIAYVMVKKLGEEVAESILRADAIEAEVIVWEGDTLPRIVLSQWMSALTRYTLCSPALYQTNKKVYSNFEPYAWITFQHGEDKLTLYLDYSINKWMLRDGEENIICQHDLPNKEFLLMLHLLFPKSKLINKKYNEYIKSHEN